MAQIKIYGLKTNLDKHRDAISRAIHDSVMSALEYPKEKKFHRFIALNHHDFIYPDDRSDAYIIIEVSLFEGRSSAAKQSLIRALFSNIPLATGINVQDIEITLYETPKENWGIRGMPANEIALDYTVEV